MTLPEITTTVAYNGGPGTLAYPGPRSGAERDLVLKPWRHTPVPDYFLRDPRFRRDVKSGLVQLKEVSDLPEDSHFKLPERFEGDLSEQAKQMVVRLCSEEYVNDSRGMNPWKDLINLGDQVNANGRPAANSRVTVKFLKENHRLFLEAVLEVERGWRKRKAVIRDVQAALKKIDTL